MSEDNIQYFLNELPHHYDEPDWLTKCAIQLATLLHNHASAVAAARAQEASVLLKWLDARDPETSKKMSVAEAERRACEETHNEYERLKLEYDAVGEVINAIKKRLDTMAQLAKSGI